MSVWGRRADAWFEKHAAGRPWAVVLVALAAVLAAVAVLGAAPASMAVGAVVTLALAAAVAVIVIGSLALRRF